MAKIKPIEIDLTPARIAELREGGEIKCGHTEFGVLLDLALETLAKETAISNDELLNLRGTLRTNMENLRECATKLAASNSARMLAARDLGSSEAHCESLIRRLQDSIAIEKSIRQWQEEFERSVHKCMDRQELGPVASMNPTLLRLQEALESTIHEAPPAK